MTHFSWHLLSWHLKLIMNQHQQDHSSQGKTFPQLYEALSKMDELILGLYVIDKRKLFAINNIKDLKYSK